LVSKIIIIIASLVSLTLIVGLSMNGSTSLDNTTQSTLENTPPPPFEYVDSSVEEKLNDIGFSLNEYLAMRTVQDYQGTDKEGRNIKDLTAYITESLLLEEEKNYPSTNFGWKGLPNDLAGNDSIYKVIYEIKTDKQRFEVIYNIDLETREIWGVNDIAKDILILADMPESLTNG